MLAAVWCVEVEDGAHHCVDCCVTVMMWWRCRSTIFLLKSFDGSFAIPRVFLFRMHD